MPDRPIALDAYEELAEAYAAVIDTKPHNAYYERPATLSLLPDVGGRRVLDAGCGPGVYSEWLLARGAEVVAVDASAKMVALTKRRLGRSTDIHQADLGEPLDFLEGSSFDLILCPLVMEYIEDWGRTFAEFYRLLRLDGHFIFSVTHPHFDFLYYQSNDYFAVERVGSVWRGFAPCRVYMPSFRRSLEATIMPLLEAGFHLETILEPRPTAQLKEADPKHYEELSRQPAFLCLRARKQ